LVSMPGAAEAVPEDVLQPPARIAFPRLGIRDEAR